jgi:hypothetical protein
LTKEEAIMNNKPFRALALCLGIFAITFLMQGIAQAQAIRSWSQNNNATQRFVTLAEFNNEAVLDRTTGLIWEKNVSTTNGDWTTAYNACLAQTHPNTAGPNAGSFGWRLPKFEEVASLFATGIVVGPPFNGLLVVLPSGHPFTGNATGNFWTASESSDGTQARIFGGTSYTNQLTIKTSTNAAFWCVRGGAN